MISVSQQICDYSARSGLPHDVCYRLLEAKVARRIARVLAQAHAGFQRRFDRAWPSPSPEREAARLAYARRWGRELA